MNLSTSTPKIIPMKKGAIIQYILIAMISIEQVSAQVPAFAQADSPEALEWVARQSGRIDSLLNDAMRGSEPIEVLVRLTDCYQVFDAVAMAGLYCTNVRAAAEAGRRQCDVINYRLEKDLNTNLQRAVEARRQATLMKAAARYCQSISVTVGKEKAFTPNDLIRHDAYMAELDLLDGLSTNDLHLLSQKLEHAIRLLYDVEHLAFTLSNCDIPMGLAESAVIHCQNALGAPNWLDVHRSVQSALANVQAIQQSSMCY